jgi:hypothetical protein
LPAIGKAKTDAAWHALDVLPITMDAESLEGHRVLAVKPFPAQRLLEFTSTNLAACIRYVPFRAFEPRTHAVVAILERRREKDGGPSRAATLTWTGVMLP